MEEGNNNTTGSTEERLEMKTSSTNGSANRVDNIVEMNEKLEDHEDDDVVYRQIVERKPSSHRSCLPVLFERSKLGLLNPRFDSPKLEEQLVLSFFPQERRKFRYALIYVMLVCVGWLVFVASTSRSSSNFLGYMLGTSAQILTAILFFILTFYPIYTKHYFKFSVVFSIILMVMSLLRYANYSHMNFNLMSSVGSFCGLVEIVLLLYNLIPLPLYLAFGLSVVYSIIYEALFIYTTTNPSAAFIVGKILLHLCIHIVCISLYLMSSVRKHSTFWRIGQSMIARKQLQVEKKLKEDFIYSLMPENVAKEAMQNRTNGDNDKEEMDQDYMGGDDMPGTVAAQIKFRQFTMDRMSEVSILFADIVGFTKMSSNKTAEHLVGLLNDLFGRFDDLCTKNNCEKISTLGDCYYCVSGCPVPDANHARNCLNLGLDMVEAIYQFDEDHNEEVNMRVGIHTGTVLCGIVGTRRFKFDVWSHDVDLANVMESTGEPGRVHVSEATYVFLKDEYNVEPGETVEDTRKVRNLTEQYDSETCKFGVQQVESSGTTATYFIIGPKDGSRNKTSTTDQSESQTVCDTSHRNSVPTTTLAVGTNGGAVYQPTTPEEQRLEDSGLTREEERVDLIVSDKQVTVSVVHTEQCPLPPLTSPASAFEDEEKQMRSSFFGKRKKSSGTDSIMGTNRKGSKYETKEDHQIIKAMQEEADGSADSYFYEPPVNKCTMSFTECKDERAYRSHTSEDFLSPKYPQSFASPRFNVFLDIWVSTVYYTLLVIVMMCVFGVEINNNLAWFIYLVVSLIFIAFQAVAITLTVFTGQRSFQSSNEISAEAADQTSQVSGFSKLVGICYSWITSHILGLIQLAIPLGVVYSRFTCQTLTDMGNNSELFFCYAVITAIVHSINFNLLNSWMKSTIATIGGVVLVVVANINTCPDKIGNVAMMSQVNNISSNATSLLLFNGKSGAGDNMMHIELILDIVLLLILIWFLNREIELLTRLAFNGDLQAAKDKKEAENEKAQADSLLHDMVPCHVMDEIKLKGEYSQSHKDVGVVFISITNFDEFYDESFEGGKEFLRVLNELFMDYESLFTKKKYKDIEKIKTIGSTFMAASGLDQAERDKNADPKEHLCALMDFCMEIIETVDAFNEGMFNFDFTLKIGYNVGDIVSGVIGTSKLHFDIWGNTVNVSSRMYSTGVVGRVQVTEDTAKMLEHRYKFEYRDTIFVKGKGKMRTYLLQGKRTDEIE